MLAPCCCFTGHRRLSAAVADRLASELDQQLERLFFEGVRDFYCGGALGFDTLAEEAVLRLRTKAPSVRLHLILPCPDQADRWSVRDRERYARLLEEADDVEYVSDSYTPSCLFERNRRLVDYTTICMAYQTHTGGGTDYTVRYARQQGKRLILLQA